MTQRTRIVSLFTVFMLALCMLPGVALAGEPFSWNGTNWVGVDGKTPIIGAKRKGVDVSFYDGYIDWEAAIADDISFAIIRAWHTGEGAGLDSGVDKDLYWDRNVAECERLGIPFGVYCYSEARTVEEASREADAVLALLEGHSLSYPVYLDLEEPSMESVENRELFGQIARVFCGKMEAEGYPTGFYSNLRWRTNYLTDPYFDTLDFWLAEWTRLESEDQDEKLLYTYTGDFSLWQAGSDTIDGFQSAIQDINFDFSDRGLSVGATVIPRNVTAGSVYRLYNPNSGEHFYTLSYAEALNAYTEGWSYEGIGWVAPTHSSTPVHRLYNANNGDHHYTISAGERDLLIAAGWNSEGVAWYSDDNKTVPLLRQYNPNALSGAHNFTTSQGENDLLVQAGWNAEGIGWYAVSKG